MTGAQFQAEHRARGLKAADAALIVCRSPRTINDWCRAENCLKNIPEGARRLWEASKDLA